MSLDQPLDVEQILPLLARPPFWILRGPDLALQDVFNRSDGQPEA
jgi:hypothetical protein